MESELFFRVSVEPDSDIIVTGVGLIISPGSDVMATLECGDNVTTKRVQNTGEGDIVPVYFDQPICLDQAPESERGPPVFDEYHMMDYNMMRYQMMREQYWKIEATIKGTGVARVPDVFDPLPRSYSNGDEEVEVDGRNKQGQKVGKVTFDFKCSSSRIISELYFYVNSDGRPT